jgi:hypothetical protein
MYDRLLPRNDADSAGGGRRAIAANPRRLFRVWVLAMAAGFVLLGSAIWYNIGASQPPDPPVVAEQS